LENVMAAARTAMQGKMSGHAAARFHARWETHAVRLHEELTTGTWQPGKYTYFDIHEPKLRRVAAAPFRDRVVHHALVRVLEPIFEKKFIEDSYACRKGKGTHAGVRRCAEFSRRFPYVLKCDLRRYFPSIDHEILLQRIGRIKVRGTSVRRYVKKSGSSRGLRGGSWYNNGISLASSFRSNGDPSSGTSASGSVLPVSLNQRRLS
jgi:retron-type reverse transcriptase